MVEEPKKLVRGLKDISPLFGGTPEAEVGTARAPEVQILAVSGPDHDGDSLFLNAFFASQIVSQEKECSLVSVLSRCAEGEAAVCGMPEAYGESIRRYCLYWDELRDLIGTPCSRKADGVLKSRDIFLDFEYRHLLHCERVMTLVDKWVLLLKPTAESLTEGYKMLKTGAVLHPQLECFVALEGRAEESKGEMIFEKFSDLVGRHLNIRLGWLGWMDLEDPSRHFSSALYTDALHYQAWNARPCLERSRLAGWIESSKKRASGHALPEVLR